VIEVLAGWLAGAAVARGARPPSPEERDSWALCQCPFFVENAYTVVVL
jgi:hypothetical protein